MKVLFTKIISISLALSTLFFSNSSGVEPINNETSQIDNTQIMIESVDSNLVTEEEAATLALIYVANMIDTESTSWNNATKIDTVQTLYGENDEVTAYTIYLADDYDKKGYIIISRYSCRYQQR